MSGIDTDHVSVSSDGVTVKKSLNAEDFQTLAVVLEIATELDEPVDLTLTDEVPDEVSMEDVGFHPQYGAQHWTSGDGVVTFERRLEPDETLVTIYGVREYDEQVAERFLGEPHLEVAVASEVAGTVGAGTEAEPAASSVGFEDVAEDLDELEQIVSMEHSDAVRGLLSGERDGLGLGEEAEEPLVEAEAAADTADESAAEASTAPADEAAEPAVGDAEPLDPDAPTGLDDVATEEPATDPLADATPPEAADAVESGGDDDPTPEPTIDAPADSEATDDEELTVPVTGGVTRVLIKELRGGNVSEADRRELRSALFPDDDEAPQRGSVEARFRSLQQSVADLEAYTGALEEFLDENGTASQVLDDVRAEIDDVASDVEAVEADVQSVRTTVDDVSDEFGEMTEEVHSVSDEFDDIRQAVEEVRTEVRGIRETTTALTDRADGYDDRLEDHTARLDREATAREELESSVASVESTVEAVRGELGAIEGLEADIEAIHEELVQLQEFRERLSTVFAAQTGDTSDDTDPAGSDAGDDEAE